MTRAVEPLVSVLVPAYNVEATLAETLQSALASSYSNLEIVLVDDGSTDATAAIAEAFARDDQRLRIFRQQHRGVSAALNFGLDHIRGDLVAPLDPDDLWHPTKLARQVDLISADPTPVPTFTFRRHPESVNARVHDPAPA